MPPPLEAEGSGEPAAAAASNTIVPYPNVHGWRPHTAATVYPVTLKFEEVAYKVKVGQNKKKGWGWSGGRGWAEKSILNGLSGVVFPGEILALLGPSGSGKTTLLSALGGRLGGSLSGEITYNGQPFTAMKMRRRTGFVAQDDILYPHLTVSETLLFTALLRLPRTLTRAHKAAEAQRVMSELGLTRVAHTIIGGRLLRGVSGGERKRVSIAQELLLDPSLLLLDEPTSGLDSTTAQRILTTLCRLAARGGRTVVTTIHQPSSRLYAMFDKALLLSEGRPIYYGRAADALDYFAAIGFSFPVISSVGANPADLLLDLANGIAPNAKHEEDDGEQSNSRRVREEEEHRAIRQQLISAYQHNIAAKLKAELCAVDPTSSCGYAKDVPTVVKKSKRERHHDEYWSTSWWEQFRVLLRRSLLERRHETFNKLRIFQVVSVATLGGLLWWRTPPSHMQDRTSLIFFFSVFWGFFPLHNAVFIFPQERAMLRKERSSGMYRLSAYFMARTAGDLPMELALPTAFVVIIYWMGGLRAEVGAFLLSILVVLYSVLVAQSLGMAMGALLMDVKQATTLASVITLVFLIAGGYYVQHIPPFIAWLRYLSYSFYCFRLLLGVQIRGDELYPCPTPTGAVCRAADFPAIKAVGLTHMWADACSMALMLLGYRLLAYFALRRLLGI